MRISSSHVPGGCLVPKPFSGFINCQLFWLMLWGSAGAAVLTEISQYSTYPGGTFAAFNTCKNAVFRFLSSSWIFVPRIR